MPEVDLSRLPTIDEIRNATDDFELEELELALDEVVPWDYLKYSFDGISSLNELISAFSDAIEYYSGLAREGWTLDGEIDGGRVLLTNPEIASLREALYERMKQLGTGAE